MTLKDIKPLRAGIDYDLVNISLIGHDPVTGRPYEECHAEWQGWLKYVTERAERMSWWNLVERYRVVRATVILKERLGMYV